uniref:IS66 family insertion sequence element accessory protein TnpA n=1 Tax=Archangium sp. TaxID=1872627 RepID=UPI00286B4FE3
EWVRVAEEYEASGLTQREFAERRGLTLSTLQSWVYRRRRQEGAPVAQPVRLLPVQVTGAPVVSGSERLEVLTASGERVSFAVGTDVQYVARLVAALEKKAC